MAEQQGAACGHSSCLGKVKCRFVNPWAILSLITWYHTIVSRISLFLGEAEEFSFYASKLGHPKIGMVSNGQDLPDVEHRQNVSEWSQCAIDDGKNESFQREQDHPLSGSRPYFGRCCHVAALVWCVLKIPKACLRVPVSWCYLATAWNHSYIGWYPSFLGQSSWQAGRWTVAFMTALDGNEYWCVQNLMVLQFQRGETDDVCHNAFGVHNFQATPPKNNDESHLFPTKIAMT